MVDLALSSMSLAVWARTHRHPPAAIEATSRYHSLLRVVRERIAQVNTQPINEQNIDSWLLSVSLMSRYESTIYHPDALGLKDSIMSLRSWSHHDGAMGMLKVWYDNFRTDAATPIIKQTRRGLIRTCLIRSLPLPDWMLDGSHFGEKSLELDYDCIIVHVANLIHASARLQQSNDVQIAEAEGLNEQAQMLELALRDWVSQVPNTCSYQRCTLKELDPSSRRHFYSPVVYNYSRLEYAAVWSEYFALRMLINSTRLTALELSCSSLLADLTCDQQWLGCMNRLEAMADSLASTIPFCLGRFMASSLSSTALQPSIALNKDEDIKPYLANSIAWPLSIASSIHTIDASKRAFFRSELAGLGKCTGNGVLECAETNQWPLFWGRRRSRIGSVEQ